ncbi:DUF2207 domain-containing protein [Micropruina sonneratiae]|uniref:DUF2207 domain-containing protein n=1 Tax=Micropruina sonneratiae TaxID=2986940 RepID=UPI0022275343|nr:DUF2207 domain-containing protein [Micropruina sp. KQZ13P-5]MCW3159302.1 DUF2207 domain-containing protein [Micropruina sp. KQZ13P-5]
MRRLSLLLIGLGIFVLGMLPATTARADSDDDSITTYTVTADVAKDGTTSVKLAFDFDFGSDEGRGPYLTFPLRQEIANDPDHWRMLDMSLGDVTSPSGANTEVSTETQDGNLLVRIGNENTYFTGTQSYVVTYTIRGLIAPNQTTSGLDEFNWNVIGNGWEIPISNITATVTGPVDVTQSACFIDGDTSNPCQADQRGDTVTFTQSRLSDHTYLQIVAGFPAGTFVGAEARLEKRFWIGNMFPVTAATGGVTAVLTALGLGALLRRTRRGSRDQVYLGLTPGVTPAKDQQVAIGHGTSNAPVAVQFTPPRDARPGEIGVLTDSTADNVDITATIIDLAVRKHLTIEQQDKKDWTFTRLNNPERLTRYEAKLVDKLFSKGSVVTTDDLKDSDYAGLLDKTRERLYKRVTDELHWFTKNPSHVRGVAIVGGIGLTLAGGALGLALGFVGWGLVGLAGVICGIAMLALSNRFGARTAEGSAVLAQAKGFELYLTTAEADQIKFEEGIDVFSRYLPYAIVFGVADRWAKVFEQLAAEGRYVADTSWYVGYGYGYGLGFGTLTSSMDQLASTMSSSMQSATAASSGGSGFSGGGGFGGGGGGGW